MPLTDDEKDELLRELLIDKIRRPLRGGVEAYIRDMTEAQDEDGDNIFSTNLMERAGGNAVFMFTFSVYVARNIFKDDDDFAEYGEAMKLGLENSSLDEDVVAFLSACLLTKKELEEKRAKN